MNLLGLVNPWPSQPAPFVTLQKGFYSVPQCLTERAPKMHQSEWSKRIPRTYISKSPKMEKTHIMSSSCLHRVIRESVRLKFGEDTADFSLRSFLRPLFLRWLSWFFWTLCAEVHAWLHVILPALPLLVVWAVLENTTNFSDTVQSWAKVETNELIGEMQPYPFLTPLDLIYLSFCMPCSCTNESQVVSPLISYNLPW